MRVPWLLLAGLVALSAPSAAQSPEECLRQAEHWLDLTAWRRTRAWLARVHPRTAQQRFERLLLIDRLNASLSTSDRALLEQAARVAPETPVNRLRLKLRRFAVLPDPSEQSRLQWQQLQEEWSSSPLPTVAFEYYLTQSRHWRNLAEGRAELAALEEARKAARGQGERLRVLRATFSYHLDRDDYDQAEQEILKYAAEAGPPGVVSALELECDLALRRGRQRQAQALFLHLADLEHLTGESDKELDALIMVLSYERNAPVITARAWKILRKMPEGVGKFAQMLQLGRFGDKQIWPEALALWRRLPWKEQRLKFQFLVFQLRTQGRLEQALDCCRLVLAQHPNWPVALITQGQLLEEQGQLDLASSCYRQALSQQNELSEQEIVRATASLMSLLRTQQRGEELLPICREILERQPNIRARNILLTQGLMGPGTGDSNPDQQFRRWCWQQLYDLIAQLSPGDQVESLLTLTYKPPPEVRLGPIVERGLELTREQMHQWEGQANWNRYAEMCSSRARFLQAAGRQADAIECLLQADQKLGLLPPSRGSTRLLERLMWMQQGEASEATALRLLSQRVENSLACEIWLRLAVLRQETRPELALQACTEALKLAPNQTTRRRVQLIRASVLSRLERWPEVVDLLAPLDLEGSESWARTSRYSILHQAYMKLNLPDQAEALLREAHHRTAGQSWGDRVQQRLNLADFLLNKNRAESDQLVVQGFETELGLVTGPTRWRLVRSFVRTLLDQGRAAEAVRVLDEQKFPLESLAYLASRPELADWQAARPSVEAQSDSLAHFRETLVKVRGLRRDLDSHPFFQADRLELMQRQLGPRQLLLAFCPAGEQMVILGVDRQHTYVHEFGLEGSWFNQQLSQLARSPEARNYISSRLIAPIQGWIQDKDLLLVPLADGWYVPWELVGSPPLGTAGQCTRVSGADLLHLAGGDWKPFLLRDSLALGAPPEAGLDGARRELEGLARRLPQCRLEVGPRARLEALSTPASLIHLASHSEIVGRDPDASFLQLAGGKLTLSEIYRMNLAPHSLVVLSSCSSARGQTHPEGEPLSLAQAFATAGSQTEISALWPVDDEATALFFEIFYEHLAGAQSPAASLLEARRALADKGFSAADWGAFVLQGCPD